MKRRDRRFPSQPLQVITRRQRPLQTRRASPIQLWYCLSSLSWLQQIHASKYRGCSSSTFHRVTKAQQSGWFYLDGLYSLVSSLNTMTWFSPTKSLCFSCNQYSNTGAWNQFFCPWSMLPRWALYVHKMAYKKWHTFNIWKYDGGMKNIYISLLVNFWAHHLGLRIPMLDALLWVKGYLLIVLIKMLTANLSGSIMCKTDQSQS